MDSYPGGEISILQQMKVRKKNSQQKVDVSGIRIPSNYNLFSRIHISGPTP